MINTRQRIVLLIAAAVAMFAFLYQPMICKNAFCVGAGWHPFYLTEAEVGYRSVVFIQPGYSMLAAEYLALIFVTVCVLVAAGNTKR